MALRMGYVHDVFPRHAVRCYRNGALGCGLVVAFELVFLEEIFSHERPLSPSPFDSNSAGKQRHFYHRLKQRGRAKEEARCLGRGAAFGPNQRGDVQRAEGEVREGAQKPRVLTFLKDLGVKRQPVLRGCLLSFLWSDVAEAEVRRLRWYLCDCFWSAPSKRDRSIARSCIRLP